MVAPSTTDNELLNYQGGYRIVLPPTATIYQNQKPSVDGVLAPMADTLIIQTAEYIFALTHVSIEAEIPLAHFVDDASECMMVNSEMGQLRTIGARSYLFFPDAPCGPSGITYFYTIDDSQGSNLQGGDSWGYRISVEANVPYRDVATEVATILQRFLPLHHSSRPIDVVREHVPAPSGALSDEMVQEATACKLPEPVELAIKRNPGATLAEMEEAIQVGWMVLSTIHRVNIVAVPGSEEFGQPLLVVQWTGPLQTPDSAGPTTVSLLRQVAGEWRHWSICAGR